MGKRTPVSPWLRFIYFFVGHTSVFVRTASRSLNNEDFRVQFAARQLTNTSTSSSNNLEQIWQFQVRAI